MVLPDSSDTDHNEFTRRHGLTQQFSQNHGGKNVIYRCRLKIFIQCDMGVRFPEWSTDEIFREISKNRSRTPAVRRRAGWQHQSTRKQKFLVGDNNASQSLYASYRRDCE